MCFWKTTKKCLWSNRRVSPFISKWLIIKLIDRIIKIISPISVQLRDSELSLCFISVSVGLNSELLFLSLAVDFFSLCRVSHQASILTLLHLPVYSVFLLSPSCFWLLMWLNRSINIIVIYIMVTSVNVILTWPKTAANRRPFSFK